MTDRLMTGAILINEEMPASHVVLTRLVTGNVYDAEIWTRKENGNKEIRQTRIDLDHLKGWEILHRFFPGDTIMDHGDVYSIEKCVVDKDRSELYTARKHTLPYPGKKYMVCFSEDAEVVK